MQFHCKIFHMTKHKLLNINLLVLTTIQKGNTELLHEFHEKKYHILFPKIHSMSESRTVCEIHVLWPCVLQGVP